MKTKDFEGLILQWRDRGLVSIEQANQMITELNHSSSEDSGKKFIYAVGILGGLALSAGILLLISSNWSSLGKLLQLTLALLMPTFAISLAYYVIEVRKNNSIWGRALNLLGMFLIGGSLAMIGQIYNLETGYTSFIAIWAMLSALFIVVFRGSENIAFTALATGVGLITFFIEREDLYGNEQSLVITMTLSVLLYAAFLYSMGSLLRSSAVWGKGARILRLMSASVAGVTLFITTFEFYARFVLDSVYRSSDWVPLSIILNLVFIAFMIFVLLRAFKYQEEHVAFNAIRLLGFYVIVKYFTLFSTMLDTGVLMTVGGLLFIGGAWYLEKNKKYVIRMMHNDPITSLGDSPSQE